MTHKEAISILEKMFKKEANKEKAIALFMAIEALQKVEWIEEFIEKYENR